jgi:hypothetical protein
VAQSTQPPATTTQPQTSGQTQTPHQDHTAAQQVTIVGCVQREADYRSANNLGRGGAVGTGVGVGNEFVLINASMSTSMTSTAGAATGTTTGTAGTAGGAATAGAGQAFEVSGEKEAQLEQYVGKRVEVVAKLKAAETGPAGTTGGATAGKPPTGVDITSPDLRLKEIEIVSVRESTGTCPAK